MRLSGSELLYSSIEFLLHYSLTHTHTQQSEAAKCYPDETVMAAVSDLPV